MRVRVVDKAKEELTDYYYKVNEENGILSIDKKFNI